MIHTSSVTLALVAAVAAVAVTRLWRVGRLAITAVHEGGHAVVAVMAGHKVTAVHLRSDSSGVTFHEGRQRWTSRVATAAAGYSAPGAVAIAGAALTANHECRVFLAVLAALGALMLVGWIRNLFGLAVVGTLVIVIGWLLASGTARETVLGGAAATWFLALGGFRASVEQLGATGHGDGFELGRLLHLPAALCRFGFAAFGAAAVVACIVLLYR